MGAPEQAPSVALCLRAISAPSSDLASDVMVLAFQNLLLSEQGPVQGQDGQGRTRAAAPRGLNMHDYTLIKTNEPLCEMLKQDK